MKRNYFSIQLSNQSMINMSQDFSEISFGLSLRTIRDAIFSPPHHIIQQQVPVNLFWMYNGKHLSYKSINNRCLNPQNKLTSITPIFYILIFNLKFIAFNCPNKWIAQIIVVYESNYKTYYEVLKILKFVLIIIHSNNIR